MSHLFSPFRLRSVTFRNRVVVVSPMCMYSTPDGKPGSWHLVHLGSRAVGGAGCVMTEACASDHRPRSIGLMRPSCDTAHASVITQPAPPTARLPRWTRCHDPGLPSGVEYMHIGDTTTRLRKVTERRLKGEKRCDISVASCSLRHPRCRKRCGRARAERVRRGACRPAAA